MEVYNGSGTQIWSVTANMPWTVSSPEWYAASVSLGTEETMPVEFTVDGFTADRREGKGVLEAENGQSWSVNV